MATVKVLLCVFCLAAFSRVGLSGSHTVTEGKRGDDRRNKNYFRLQTAGKPGATAVIQAAQKEIGVREAGENVGKRVEQYCAYVGFRKIPWCAAFCSWCFGQAGYRVPRTAWSPALFPPGRLAKAPLPGSVYGIYFPALKRIGHCGIVESVRNDWVIGIEGNTSVAGSREGDGVYRKWRHKRSIYRYAKW